MPNEVTFSGIVIDVREVHEKNAVVPILFTPLPIVTLSRAVQLSNAWPPISVTLSGISMLVRLLHWQKVASPISVMHSISVQRLTPLPFQSA